MIVFIDESGDSGLQIGKGSSRYFTVSLVVFEDSKEAEDCDKRIELLKRELGYKSNFEFHFKRNSRKVRETFLTAVSPYNFFYYSIVINKDPTKLWGEGFKSKESFYKYACSLVFENAKDKILNATVIIDESGNLDFRRQLARYLRGKMNRDRRAIKKLKMQRSQSNNLLQLADYVAGVTNRAVMGNKKDSHLYRKIIAHREIYTQVWPN